MAIHAVSDTEWRIHSDTGGCYTVRYIGPDRQDERGYTCDCKAGQWGKVCRHIREVVILAEIAQES